MTELVCPIENCRNVPLINFYENSSKIQIRCSEHKNIKLYELKDYLNICKNKGLICSNCHNKLGLYNFIYFCQNCKKIFDDSCIVNNNCNNKSFHKKVEINYNRYFNKNICIKHNKIFSKFCKHCETSFCQKCNTKRNENHNFINIQTKTEKELDLIEQNLKSLDNAFKKMKKMINDYLEEIGDKIEMKKIILKNYNNNKYNGNSFENLNNLNISINKSYKNKIDNLFMNQAKNQEKILSLYYFHLLTEKESNENNNLLFTIQNNLKNNEIKKDFKIMIK